MAALGRDPYISFSPRPELRQAIRVLPDTP